jgi:S1-C subfamily serine protease
MRGSRRTPSRWSSSLVSLAAAVGLALAGVPGLAPATASPPTFGGFRDAPAPPADPSAMVAKVGPAVVDIDTQMSYQSAVGAGTGIVLTPNGQVLTNNHVIEGATSITAVDIGNGQTYQANVIGYDRNHDVAVLQLIGASGLTAAALGDSSRVAVGDPIVAMGNAEGAGGTPSAVPGNVTALNQTVSAADSLTGGSETLNGLIAASAAIRPGDSGCPMVNSAGEVIGMNTAASGNYQMAQPGGQGFAIPINQARSIAGQITGGNGSGSVHIGPSAFLGIGVADASGEPGAEVRQVLPDTPAAKLGLSNDDVIVSVDGAPVNSATALTNLLDQHHPGDNVQLGWHKRGESVHTGKVTLAAGPPG